MRGNHSEALTGLKLARQLGLLFYRTYAKQPKFKAGPFVPPPEPVAATAALHAEIEALRRQVIESEDAASRARREAEEHARARESAEQRLRREADERAVWEQLAQSIETERNAIAARLATLQAISSVCRCESEACGRGAGLGAMTMRRTHPSMRVAPEASNDPGGNRLLRAREREHFVFSILELVSPTMESAM